MGKIWEQTPRKIYRRQISIWKDAQCHMSLGNCKLKQQWDTTAHLLELLKPQTLSPNAGEAVERQELILCCWACKAVQPLGKTHSWFLTKLNILLPCSPAIALLGIYPNELKMYVRTKTCTWISTAALVTVAKTWKQAGCPSVGEWINCGTSANGILISAKKKWAIKPWKDTEEP